MGKISYENRYNDVFTFTKLENGDVLWEGNFKHCRFAWPNVYDRAYEAYRKDGGEMHIEEFKNAVHEYDNEKSEYTPLAKQYQKLVYSDTTKLSFVDPSGGPFISIEMDMKYIDEVFEGKIIEDLKPIPEGYLIIIKK